MLFELLCVISCLAVLCTAIAVIPSNRSMQDLAVSRIQNGLVDARWKAIVFHQPVVYCGSSDGLRCDGNWSAGQLTRSAARILKTDHALRRVVIFFYGNFGHNTEIQWMPDGSTNGRNGHFMVCAVPLHAGQVCSVLVLHFSGQMIREDHHIGSTWSRQGNAS